MQRMGSTDGISTGQSRCWMSTVRPANGMVPVDAASGVFFRVNASLCALTQYSESVLASMSFKDLLHPNNRESDHRTLMAMVHGEQWDNQNEKKVHP
jgi:PAS domain-containing protein